MKTFMAMTSLRLAASLIVGAVMLAGFPGQLFALAGAEGTMVVLTCPAGHFTATPDATGRFSFANLPEGVCQLSLTPPAVQTQSDIKSPRDAASGLPTGKRMHKPMVFMVSFDGMPEASKTITLWDSEQSPANVSVKGKQKEYTGHVTLMK